MARSFDKRLSALRALDITAPTAVDELRDALRSKNGLLVAMAAKLVAEHHVASLVSELAPAFDQLLQDPVKRDPSCRGKIAIARALDALDEWDARVFVVGVRFEQLEGPVPQDDTAAELRGICGLAHVRQFRPDVLDVLARLLADPERVPRIAAAQGFGDLGRPDTSALLRYKIAEGDDEPEVLSAAIESLLVLARDAAIPFLVELLGEHDLRAEAAALALGGARVAACFESLVAWASGCRPAQRHRVGYLALALLRTDQATTYLLEVIAAGHAADAIAAAAALATFKDVPGIVEQITTAAATQRDAKTKAAILATLD